MSEYELPEMTVLGLHRLIRRGEVSVEEVCRAFLQRIQKVDGNVGAFLHFEAEAVLDEARSRDQEIRKGSREILLFTGIPVAIKDVIITRDVRTSCGSRMLHDYYPPYDATVVQHLQSHGAILLGKTNCDEFAMGSSTENSAFRPTRNPWDLHRVPGGSSGGSAACVAAREAPVALGTDTGGSIRQPAAFCGVVGLKPTYGRVSRFGLVAFASSLDQAGPIAHTVRDSAIMLKSMASVDAKDTTSVDLPVPDYEAAIGKSVKGLKIGIPAEYRLDGMPADIEALWQKGIDWLKDAGAEIVDIAMPHTKYALPAYYIVAPAEASSNLARYDGVRYGLRVPGKDIVEMYENTRAEGFGEEVKRRILIGTYVLSAGFYDAYYTQAQKIRTLVSRDFEQAFGQCDAILAPTTPTASFPLGSLNEDPLTMYLNDVFAVPASLAGLPAMSVPAMVNDDGLPLGLQIVGKPFDEQGVLNTGLAIQQRAGFDAQPEKWW